MVSRKYRFHGHGSLRYVYQNGQTVRGSQLSIRYVANTKRKSYRVAVVVSKKVSKSAVVRNRIRRRLYEIIRANQGNIKQPFDIVITVFHEEVKDMPHQQLENSLTKQLKEAKIIS